MAKPTEQVGSKLAYLNDGENRPHTTRTRTPMPGEQRGIAGYLTAPVLLLGLLFAAADVADGIAGAPAPAHDGSYPASVFGTSVRPDVALILIFTMLTIGAAISPWRRALGIAKSRVGFVGNLRIAPVRAAGTRRSSLVYLPSFSPGFVRSPP